MVVKSLISRRTGNKPVKSETPAQPSTTDNPTIRSLLWKKQPGSVLWLELCSRTKAPLLKNMALILTKSRHHF